MGGGWVRDRKDDFVRVRQSQQNMPLTPLGLRLILGGRLLCDRDEYHVRFVTR